MIRCIVCFIDMSIRIYIPIEFGYPLQEILDQLNKNSTHQQSSSKQDLDEDQPVTVSLQSKANEDVNDSKST